MSELNQFEWSLRPFVILLRCIGIYLPDGKTSKFKRIFQSLHMLMSFLLNFAIQTAGLYISFRSIKYGSVKMDKLELKTYSKMSEIINFIGFSSVIEHLILIFVVRPQWNILMNCLIRLESEIEPEISNKIRQISVVCVCFVPVLVRFSSRILNHKIN